MRILILGATGRTGKWLLKEALNRGYQVNILVREKKNIDPDPLLTIYEGNPGNSADMKSAIGGCTAVLSALNISRRNDFPWSGLRTPPGFLSVTAGNIIALCEEISIKRVLVTSAWGVNETKSQLPVWFRWLIDHSNLAIAYRDHELQEQYFIRSNLMWTCVRPVILTNGKKAKTVKVSLNGNPKSSLFISRRNVALFMLNELVEERFLMQLPTIYE